MIDFLIYVLRYLLKIVVIFNRKLYQYPLNDDGIISSSIPDRNIYIEGIRYGRPLTAIHFKGMHAMYKVITENGYEVICSGEHLFYDSFMNIIKCSEIKKRKTWLITKEGVSRVEKIYQLEKNEFVYDVTVASGEQSYFTDGILSHNSIISSIFITWYILTNVDRNVLCTSARADKVKELIDKIDVIMTNLPFYMKLGVEIDNVWVKSYDNGCKLVGETASENAGASLAIHLLYADEFALVDPGIIREFFRVLYPTLSSSAISKMIITSTARGLNKFYEIYDDAINGKNFFNAIRTDWWEVDGRDETWRRQEVANLGSEEDFAQEYGNQFLAGNQLLFNSAILKRMKKYECHFIGGRLKETS